MKRKLFLLIFVVLFSGVILATPPILILNLFWNPMSNPPGPDVKSSVDDFENALNTLGYSYDRVDMDLNSSITTVNFDPYQLVIIIDGVTCFTVENHRMTASEGQHIKDYLQNGGKVYMEGNDVWLFDVVNNNTYDFSNDFGFSATDVGSDPYNNWFDCYELKGKSGTFTAGVDMFFDDPDNHNSCFWTTKLEPSKTGASSIFDLYPEDLNLYFPFSCAVAYDSGTYKTIAAGFELGALSSSSSGDTKTTLVQKIIDWFGITASVDYGDLNGDGNVDTTDFQTLANYLAGNLNHGDDPFTSPLSNADLDGSGDVNCTDLTILANYLTGNITSLPF